MLTPSSIASSTTHTGSISPATACDALVPTKHPRIDQPATECQKLSASEAPDPGRHHVGILGDIIPESPGGFVGIRTAVIHDSRRRSELRLNADCGGYAIDTLAGHDVLDRHHRCRARRTAGAPRVLHAASTTLFMPSIGGDEA